MKSWIPCVAVLAMVAASGALAGGSNYGIVPGALPRIGGTVTEWSVPTPRFARDPAPGPDGNIYIAVMAGNKIARFNTATQTFDEWALPEGAHPHGLLVDADGIVWYTGNGHGTIGRFDPRSGKVAELRLPSGGDPHTLVIDDKGIIWFTVLNGQRVGRLDRTSGKITEYRPSGNPYGIAIDKQGRVWFCRIAADKLGRLDPATGTIADGNGKLLKVDPLRSKVAKAYAMPAGPRGGPYAVTVDGAGRVWVDEIDTDTVALFDPDTEKFRVIALPSKSVGIRKAIIDAHGRYWYMGSHNGRLGMIE